MPPRFADGNGAEEGVEMNFRTLTSCVLLSSLVLSLLCTEVQANEYREVNAEVKAEDILKHIEMGDDVNLTGCRIVGDLDISRIKLKTILNPCINKYRTGSMKGIPASTFGLSENSSVIETNITIQNSTFENDLNLSNVLFRKSVKFYRTSFKDSVHFDGTNFNNSANFSWTNFDNFANFGWANFNNPANFIGAKFDRDANFVGVNFNDPVHFGWAIFKNSAHFDWVNFNDSASFDGTHFNNSVYFDGANFKGSTRFIWSDFNDTAYFGGPDTFKKIMTDGKSCEIFQKYYKKEARYTDADNIYYEYRKYSQERKSAMSLSKWIDYLSWATCGYGVRPLHTLYFVGVLIISFSLVYFKGQGIIKQEKNSENQPPENQPQDLSFLDALYFSIATFTGRGNSNCHLKEDFRKWVMLEGLLGWIILAIFTATLLNVMIRV